MMRSLGLALVVLASVLTISGCTYNAQAPTRMPVVYTGNMGYDGNYYGSGYRDYGYGYRGGNVYKSCNVVKAGSYHHGKYYKHARTYCNYYNRGYWGCVKYIPAFAEQNRVCSEWVWMPRNYGYMYNK